MNVEKKCEQCPGGWTLPRNVKAENFVGTVAANVDNPKLSDKEFRQFIRNTLPIVIYNPGQFPLYEGRKKQKAKSATTSAFNSLDLMNEMRFGNGNGV